ncbi:MAG: diacylglycerol kinase [Alteromonadaceae bacterium]|nr:diacylglycerol kinase [Alteromonadaceae bacterium]MBH84108.1 diacylglycerol kinase [Alteromonadaceae bacterium]|tara:strand:- start:20904 stop:21773 length:870 start_codon:yes stop_codon:yes gene_type:complete
MRYWLIANPKAGNGARGADFWQKHLEEAGITDINRCSLDDQDWVNQVNETDCLLAAGGDGSVNASARLCLQTGATLGILPSGTANDFARNLGLPSQPKAICKLIASGHNQLIDVARFNDEIFLNVAHVGLGSWPARQATGQTKKALGKFSYGVSLLQKAVAYRGFRAEIQCENGLTSGRWLSIAVATGAFYGGGNEIPEASANDGQLDVMAVRPRSLIRLFVTFVAVRIMRRSPKSTHTLVQIKSRWCKIDTTKHKVITADGEVMGQTPLDIRCQPACLRVICEKVVST